MWMKRLMKMFSEERMSNDRIAKRVYIGECTGSCSVGKPWKRWIDTVKDCLKKLSPFTPILHHSPYLPDIQTFLP